MSCLLSQWKGITLHSRRFRPTAPAIDAAGAASNLAHFRKLVACRQPWRPSYVPAAQLRRGVGRHLNPKATNRTAGHAAARIKNIHLNDKYRTLTIKYRYSRKDIHPRTPMRSNYRIGMVYSFHQ